MKRLIYSAAILALVSVPAFAAKNEQTFTFPEALTVGSTQLPAGQYKVSWTGTGSDVQVTILQKGKTPAVLSAKTTDAKIARNGITVNHLGGVSQLEALQVGKTNLVFASAPTVGQ